MGVGGPSGVSELPGSSGKTSTTDHWICLTRRDAHDPNRYYANDPATGAEISLTRLSDGRLFADRATQPYVTSGEFVTFTLPTSATHGRL